MKLPTSWLRPRSPAIWLTAGSFAAALALTAAGAGQARAGASPTAGARLVPDRPGVALRVLDWALWNVSKHYVEPSRLDPHAMALAGMEAIEDSVPEVLVEPSADGTEVRVQVGTDQETFSLRKDLALWAVTPRISQVLRFVEAHTTIDEDRRRDIEYAIVDEVLRTLDPHTNLLRPEVFEDMKTSTQGSFGGLGIEVGMRDGFITVIRVIDGNPASKVDMQPGDRIVQIDAESTVTMTLSEAVKLLRGPPGTTVAVYVMRENLATPKRLDITRATIKLDSVVGDVIRPVGPDGKPHPVGVLQISRNFAQTTPKELRKKLDEFHAAGVEGLVLDLRGNPGGLLTSAVEVADAFLSSGMIVATVGRNPSQRDENVANDRYDFDPVPLTVLVNEGSASASEIVAGALHNQGRAILLGRRTFGKGSVQVLNERRYGKDELALKLTIAQYLIPGDESIQTVGVTPDIETIPVYITKSIVEYFGHERFNRLREATFRKHLDSRKTKAHDSPFGPLYFLGRGSLGAKGKTRKTDDPPSKSKKAAKGAARAKLLLEDPEIRMASELTLWAPSPDRDAILPRLGEFVQDEAAKEQAKIRASLAELGVDWTPGPAPAAGAEPPKLTVAIAMEHPGDETRSKGATVSGTPPGPRASAAGVIPAGEKGKVIMRVTNQGATPAYQVRAITESADPYFDEREFFFGRMDPGQTREFAVELAVAEHELSRVERIHFQVHAQYPAPLAPGSQTTLDIRSEGRPRPLFAYGFQFLDAPTAGKHVRGNGDGRLQVGERVRVFLDVRNQGRGAALDPWITLRNRSGSALFLHTGRAHEKPIDPGADRQTFLDLEVQSMPKDGVAKVRIIVSDNKLAEVLSESFEFPVEESAPAPTPMRRVAELPEGATLYASADLSRPVARVRETSAFRATARFGDAVRLELGKGRFAFAPASALGADARRPRPKVAPVYSVSPPRIVLRDPVAHTTAPWIRVRGEAVDDQAVRDVYVTVSDPLRDWMSGREKVYYTASRDPKSGKLEFDAKVPLEVGNNLIEIYAREDEDIVGSTRMWVLRTQPSSDKPASK